MKNISFLIVFLFAHQISKATDYYVSNNGSNSSMGLTEATAFKTVTYASTKAIHGDTILVMPGIYTNDSYGVWDIWKTEQAVRISNKTTTTDNYLVIKPQISGTVTFKSDGNFIFQIRNSSHIRIQGFEIVGERDNISLETALQYQFTYKDANGLVTERVPFGTPTTTVGTMSFPIFSGTTRPSLFNSDALIVQNSHHIDVLDNTIHKSTSAGIRIAGSDYINVINNIVKDCNQRTSVGTPALVLSLINSIDNNNDVKIVIARNKVYDNYNRLYSWNASKDFINPIIDEGKGISLEHCITRTGLNEPSWEFGRVLIENNICYSNGFSGINTNEAERVDIINNTCYQNILSGRGSNTGISVNEAKDVNVYNNISYSVNSFGGDAYSIRNSSKVNFSNNLANGSIDSDVDLIDVATIFADPLFEDTINFKLTSTSPAINKALISALPKTDYYGYLRGINNDLGAVSYKTNVLSVDKNENDNYFIYPNPTMDFVTINNCASDNFRLFSINGLDCSELVQKIRTENSIRLNVSYLAIGIYILNINGTWTKIIKK